MTRTDPLVDRLRDAAAHVDVPELDAESMAGHAVRTVRRRRSAAGGALAAVVLAGAVVLAPGVGDRVREPLTTFPAEVAPSPVPSTGAGDEVLTDELPRVDGVVPGVPEGWQEHELAGLLYALPSSWRPHSDPARDQPRYRAWVSGPDDAVAPGTPGDAHVSVGTGYATWQVPDDAYLAEAAGTWEATVETAAVPGADYVVVQRTPFVVDGTPGVQVQVQVREAGGVGYGLVLSVPDTVRGEEIVRGLLGSLSFADD
ncbi:hypothetical protein [Cellulosimicrobium sp. NPDC057127]|uniref:hypothetical protein n=1 Tax=Cellulosimicrobium sp. NPDC057127 TaxID=3346026 RepID=UPI003643FD4D